MTLEDAIKSCFSPTVYLSVKGHLSPPEMLKAAALECFIYPKGREIETIIREALLHLWTVGEMPK